jgi:hypothetical protein
MKAATIFHLVLGLLIISFFSLPPQSLAQDTGNLDPSEKFLSEELAQMLAPIALYPDALLSQILMGATYPIEVIEADRWLRRNPELKSEAFEAALLAEDWAPSVKALTHFPSILALMSERISETTNLGNAFLAQEEEVMDVVQELRAKAEAQGNLTTTSEQKVIIEKETIIIESVDPRVIYVPYYDPFYIYGTWWYPAYPPYYWAPHGARIGIGISYWPPFYFGFAFGYWSHFDWPHHHIYINAHKRPRFVRHDRWISRPGRWNHAPRHRRGVAYREKSTARRYGQSPLRPRRFQRDTRGFPEQLSRDRDRSRIDRDTRDVDRSRIAPDRLAPVLDDRDKQRSEQPERQGEARQQPQRRDQQIREDAMRSRQERARIERVERDQKKQPRAEQEKRARTERVERVRKKQPQAKQERRTRQRVKHQQQVRSRDNVFNRVGDGRRERKSSKRGRISRQGRGQGRRDGARDRGRSSGKARGGRDDRGRNR